MGNLSGSVESYNNGKYKLSGTYSYTDGSIYFDAKGEITNAFDKQQYCYLRWSTDNSTWLPSASGQKAQSTRKSGQTTWAQRSVNGEKLYVGIKYGSGAWSTDEITIHRTQTPSEVKATKVNDACIQVDVKGNSGAGYPVSKVKIERSNDASSWTELTEISVSTNDNEYNVSYQDLTVETGNRYYYQASAYNGTRGYSDPKKVGPIYTSADSGDISNVSTSQSGNTVTVSWTCSLSAIQSGSITSFVVQRSSGATFATIGKVSAVVGQSNYTYTDYVTNGGSYSYQISASGSGGQSSGGATGGSEIETSPNAPSSVSVYRNTSDNVVITVTGASSNADSVVIERSIDGGSYSAIATETYASSVTYTDTSATASDNIVYRAKYTNSTGSSGYAYSTAVLVKQKPNAPYLKSPYNGTPIDKAQGTVRLVWEHRPLDGSPQQNARLQYKIGSGSWTTVSLTTATYYDLDISSMTANAVITWKVSTKGSHADYSDYSSEYTLSIKTRPTLEFTEPDNADVITSLPVVMEWSYNDACGTLQELKVEVVKDNEVVKSFNVDVGSGQSGTYSYSLAGFLFDNNTVYGLKAYALSSSGLTAEDNISVTIQYAEVSIAGGLLPSVVSDAETGYATITCLRDVTDGVSPVTISEAYLYRVHDNETVLIDAVTEGMQILDKYAPINVDYQYKLLYMTTGGSVAIVSVTVRNMSQYWFCYFGDEIAKAIWNPTGSVTLGRPQRTEVRYSGRRFPVSYDQDALEETCLFSTVLMERDKLNKFRKLMQSGGQGIWKSGDGDAYDANFTFDYSSDFKSNQPMWNCTLAVTRIDGGE